MITGTYRKKLDEFQSKNIKILFMYNRIIGRIDHISIDVIYHVENIAINTNGKNKDQVNMATIASES